MVRSQKSIGGVTGIAVGNSFYKIGDRTVCAREHRKQGDGNDVQQWVSTSALHARVGNRSEVVFQTRVQYFDRRRHG